MGFAGQYDEARGQQCTCSTKPERARHAEIVDREAADQCAKPDRQLRD